MTFLDFLWTVFSRFFAARIEQELTARIPKLFEDKEWVNRHHLLLTKAIKGSADDAERKQLAKEITDHLNLRGSGLRDSTAAPKP